MKTSVLGMFGLALIAAGNTSAQQGRITGPATGLVFDPEVRALRPVMGIPGAATIGLPADFAQDLGAAWVAPRLDAAIGVAADGSLRLYRIAGGAASERTLEGSVAGTVSGVIYSPSGSAVVLRSSRGLQMITGLPDNPKVAGAISLGIIPRGHAEAQRTSLAVSDDGAYVLASVAGSLRVLTTSGENRKLADVSADATVAFAPGSHDAAVDDGTTGIVLYQNLAGAAAAKVLAAPVEPTVPSSGLAFSFDGRRLFSASASARTVTVVDVASGSRGTVPCNCTPTGLDRMGNVFRLNEFSREPLWLLDAEKSEPRIVFVPAATN